MISKMDPKRAQKTIPLFCYIPGVEDDVWIYFVINVFPIQQLYRRHPVQYCQCDQWTKWNPWTSGTNGSNVLGRFCVLCITSWIVLDCLHCLYCFLACFGLFCLLVLFPGLICIALSVSSVFVVLHYLHSLHLWNSYTFFWNPRIARSAPRSASNTWAKLSATHID